jgi:ATPase family protein associated with various cellular activities (AAA)
MTERTNGWMRYRGDGRSPSGGTATTRGEQGRYLADSRLVTAVNTAIAVGQPLLITGEPGTGKTMLAWSIAAELGLGSVLEFHTRSDNQARDLLYEFDYMARFYHAQTRDPRAEQLELYIRWHALGEAIRSPRRRGISRTISWTNWIGWSFACRSSASRSKLPIALSSSSPATASGSCPILSCDAASSTGSTFRPGSVCRRSFASASAISASLSD